MGAGAAPTHLKIQPQPTSSAAKPNRRKCHEITISSSASPQPDPDPNSLTGISTNTWRAPMELYDVVQTSPSSFTKFNSALTAGLLNPMSPPPTPPITKSSPTLFEMMSSEPDCRAQPPPKPVVAHKNADRQLVRQQRISEMLGDRSPGDPFNDPGSSDINTH